MRVLILCCAGLLVAAVAGLARADWTARGYAANNEPLLTGTVISADEHSLVLKTDDGEQMTLLVDSRTLLPTELTPGTWVKVEFHLMENGSYRALRVTPEWGREARAEQNAMSMSHSGGAHPVMALATPTTARSEASGSQGYASGTSPSGGSASGGGSEASGGASTQGSASGTWQGSGTAGKDSATGGTSSSGASSATPASGSRTLPKTASPEPLYAAAGLLALMAGAGLALLRRRLAHSRQG